MTKTETKKILSVLKRAMKTVSRPLAWAQGSWGKKIDVAGNTVQTWSWLSGRQSARKTDANCWCAAGAVFAATPDNNIADAAINALRETGCIGVGKAKGQSIVVFNDDAGTTQKDVVTVFEKTIKRLEKAVSA